MQAILTRELSTGTQERRLPSDSFGNFAVRIAE